MKVLYRSEDASQLHGAPDIQITHSAVLINPESSINLLRHSCSPGFKGLEDAGSKVLKDELLSYQLRLNRPVYQHNSRIGDMLIYDDEQFLQKRDAFEEIRFLKAARLFLSPDRFAIPDWRNDSVVSLLISSSIVKTNVTDVEVKNVHNSNYWSFVFLRLVSF